VGLIQRLQQLDDRLGLDSASKRDQAAARLSALDELPDEVRASVRRRRLLAAVLTTLAAIAVALAVGRLFSFGQPATMILTFLAILAPSMATSLATKKAEDAALARHSETADGRG
jgi:hypothetical protein